MRRPSRALGGLTLLLLLSPLTARAAHSDGGQQTRLLAQLTAIDRKLVQAEAALAHNDALVSATARELSAAESARAAADSAYAQAMGKLGRRLGALTRMAPAARLRALRGVRDLSAWVDEQQLLSAIAKHDRQLWAAHRATREQLSQAIGMAQERASALTVQQGQHRDARDTLVRSRQRKDRALQSLRKRHKMRALGAELQLAQVRLGELVAENQNADASGSPTTLQPHVARPSKLPWPAQGPLRVGFGQRTESVFGTATYHNGWDIRAATGSQVTAVAAGVVAYAAWLHGYGQVAIVEHPGGFHTVHGHLGQLHVAQGQRVRMGDPLGTVGDTGSLRGTVLYFEIRHRGVPQDPRLYLARR